MTDPSEEPAETPLDLANFLWACLNTRRSEYDEEMEREGHSDLFRGVDALEAFAFELVTTGRIPKAAEDSLQSYMPGDSVNAKVQELLRYNVVRDLIEFQVADDVLGKLDGVSQRIGLTTVAFALLQRSRPSEIAIKYLERASRLFLAGYEAEVVIMSAAVLEAALSERFPDGMLKAAGMVPKLGPNYSVAQRMKLEKVEPVFTAEQRAKAWEIINSRNDAVHVHPELPISPAAALIFTAWLLPAILPGDPPGSV